MNHFLRKTLVAVISALVLLVQYVPAVAGTSDTKDNKEKPQFFIYRNTSGSFDAERLKRIDTYLNRMINEGVVPQIVTFVAKDGIVVHNKAYGYRNIEQREVCSTDDIFRNASQTKAVVTAALMTLFEEGKFNLDDPVKKFIPEFENPQVFVSLNDDTTFVSRPASCDVTIRHLLSHSSGITYGTSWGNPWKAIFEKADIPGVYSLKSLTTQEVARRIGKMPLLHDPGTAFTYGLNIDVAGALIEIISGEPLDRFMKERIFDPLGMKDTYFYLPESKVNRLVTLYTKSKGEDLKPCIIPDFQKYPYSGAKTWFSGGAGLCGTIEDYARFCQMILNGGVFNGNRILGRKTVELMGKNNVGNLRGKNGFGLGFETFEEKDSFYSPVSVGSLSWGGMYHTNYIIDRKENMIILIYSNVFPYDGPQIHNIFYNLVYQALE
ncbi:MAG: serine hydrolase [Bacteroidales bacterium]|nr:serine hydrolase [Bacteroidales bacterium]